VLAENNQSLLQDFLGMPAEEIDAHYDAGVLVSGRRVKGKSSSWKSGERFAALGEFAVFTKPLGLRMAKFDEQNH
jgi:hypothetical protein